MNRWFLCIVIAAAVAVVWVGSRHATVATRTDATVSTAEDDARTAGAAAADVVRGDLAMPSADPGARVNRPRREVSLVAGDSPAAITVTTPTVASAPLVVRGRLVDAEHHPIEPRECRVEVWHAAPDPFTQVSLADAAELVNHGDGRFQCTFRIVEPTPTAIELFVWRAPGEEREGLRASVIVPDARAPEFDAGDVTLDEWPVLVSGVVLDPKGRGVSAFVRLESVDGSTAAWNRCHEVQTSCRSDHDGRFVLRGCTRRASVSLSADDGWNDAARVDGVAPGSLGVVLRLSASTRGSIEGRVEIEEAEMLREVSLTLRPTSGRGPTPKLVLGFDGDAFAFENVVPGTYDVEVRRHRHGDELMVLDGLVVRPRTACDDPRLRPLDLRGRLVWVHGTAIDRRGRPAVQERVSYRRGPWSSSFVESDDAGRWRILIPIGAKDYEVLQADDGYVPLREGLVVRTD